MPGHLVEVFLHIESIDIVLNARVHNLLRLSDKPLNDLLSESKVRSINGLQTQYAVGSCPWETPWRHPPVSQQPAELEFQQYAPQSAAGYRPR